MAATAIRGAPCSQSVNALDDANPLGNRLVHSKGAVLVSCCISLLRTRGSSKARSGISSAWIAIGIAVLDCLVSASEQLSECVQIPSLRVGLLGFSGVPIEPSCNSRIRFVQRCSQMLTLALMQARGALLRNSGAEHSTTMPMPLIFVQDLSRICFAGQIWSGSAPGPNLTPRERAVASFVEGGALCC